MAKWRIGLVQMAPELGQIEKNRRKLLELTNKLQPGTLDLLCLPEMVMTGYVFPSANSIKPYLEKPRVGVTSRCCSDLARRLRCHVIAGYPESLSDDDSPTSEHGVGYNSAVIYGPDGEWRGGYRKTHLFMTDRPWACEGSGFGLIDLKPPLGRVSLGICMDLNPSPPAVWTSKDGPYELASFALDNNTRLLVILCAWLDSKEHTDKPWDTQTVNYWIARLLPLWRRMDDKQAEQDTIVAICNRSGVDGDTLFAGTSIILKLSPNPESIDIIGLMRRNEERVQVWEV
ncbi:carbon-nitrogen hydrolase [Ramaria rubella]|nr:carbon-nitrogen hydrolase [Ramaria rubella]